MRLTRFDVVCILSGIVWSGIALFIAQGSMGTIVWGGVLASPLIGLIVGRVFRPAYGVRRPLQFIYSLFTLYLAVALFGLAVGLYDLTRPIERDALGVVLQAIFATLWGVTFTGFVVVLWPLSYLNHRLAYRVIPQGTPRRG